MNAFSQMADFCSSRASVERTSDDLIFEVVITHVYAPTGKVAEMVRLLRDNPHRSFTSAELGERAGVMPKQVSRCLQIAREYGLVEYREGMPGLWQWA